MTFPSQVRHPKRLLYAVTAPVSASVLLRGQLAYMREQGFDVHVVSSPGEDLRRAAEREGVAAHPVPMCREISLARDFVSLWVLWRLFVRLRPEIVNASAGKAGLLAGLAAVLSGVPRRVHVMRGLRSETLGGAKRVAMEFAETVSCACAHRVVCVSPSVKNKALERRLASSRKLVVIGAGSSNGVDAQRFLPSKEFEARAEEIRRNFGIRADSPVIGFVGRLTRDKGIAELIEAFRFLRRLYPSAHLLLVGDFEEGDPVDPATRDLIRTMPGVAKTGFVQDPSVYYHVMDVLALPTLREGFPTVALEAAAAGKPVVTTNATGAIDAVVDGITGLVVPAGDHLALARALGRLLDDREVSRRLGEAGRNRVMRQFRPADVWGGLAEIYRELLSRAGRGARAATTSSLQTGPAGVELPALTGRTDDQRPG